MSYFIKTGLWEKAAKGFKGWLNLDEVIGSVSLSSTALTDAGTVDISSAKSTLTSSAAARTFTISHVGDDMTMVVTLNTTAATYTFPTNSLVVVDGTASGDNTAALSGASGDKYVIGIKKVADFYYVAIKNFGQ